MFYSDPFVNHYKSQEVDHYNFYFYENAFTEEELGYIIDWGESSDLQPGEIGSDTTQNVVSEIRQSEIGWIEFQEGTQWIFDKLAYYALDANKEMNWNFNLMGFGDEMQYTKYYGTNKGHYSWHGDVGPGVSHRKLSLVLQLTDPSEYEGGELEISIGSRTLTVPKVKNSLAVFPSFVLHRVLPVTQGERRSLVTWISGQNYM
jgi:PKHD-type hydroxylase